MSGDSRVSKDSIPKSLRKTIQEIRAFAGNHSDSDEDIYGMLKDCNMDPHEASQMLLYIGTFCEVKTRRNRRKENAESKGTANYRGEAGMLRQGARGGQGNYSSHDAAVGRSLGNQKENGVKHSQLTKNNATSDVTNSSNVAVTGPTSISNGSLIHGRAVQPTVPGAANLPKNNSAAVGTKLGIEPPQPGGDIKSPLAAMPTPNPTSTSTLQSGNKVEQGKSTSSSISVPSSMTAASDPVLVQPLNSGIRSAVGEVKHEVGSQGLGAEPVSPIPLESRSATREKFANHTELSKYVSDKVEGPEFASPVNGGSLVDSSSPYHDSKLSQGTTDPSTVEANAQPPPSGEVTTKTHKRPEPIFPNNLQVPEAYKSGLIFGSLGASFVVGVKDADCLDGENNAIAVSKSFQDTDGTAAEPCPRSRKRGRQWTRSEQIFISLFQHCSQILIHGMQTFSRKLMQRQLSIKQLSMRFSQSVSLTAPEEEYLDCPQSPAAVSANLLASEENVISDAVPKYDQLKQEMALSPEVPQYSVVQSAPTYSFGLVPPMLSSQLVQVEGLQPQARDVSQLTNFAGVNSLALSSSGPTPPGTQPTGIMQSSIPVSPQPVPVFRQPYSPFLPYGQYFSPYYMPPAVHQFLGHGGFPQQQPSTGSIYLSPAASATGLKYPLPQYKSGANIGNPGQVGVPSGFGSYGSAPVGYGPNPNMTSGSTAVIENLSVSQSQSKDNKSYNTGQQSEGSTIWIPGPGEDNSTLQSSSYYNFPPQGHHVSFPPPQAAGAFAGLYHTTHTMAAAPPSAHPLLQQPQAITGSVEKMGPLTGAYQQQQQQQQQQHAQINWNTNY